MVTWIFLSLSFAIATLIILYLFTLSTQKHNSTLRIPPGDSGWPILGESIAFAKCPGKFISERMKRHSPDIFRTYLGPEKVVFFCGPSANDFIYSNESKFRTWLPESISKALSIVDTDRRTPLCKLFNDQSHKFLRVQAIQDHIPVVDLKTRKHLDRYWIPYKEVKLHPLSKEFTFSLACSLLISRSMDNMEAQQLLEPFGKLAEGLISVPVNLPGTAYNRALRASKVLKRKLMELIKRRKEELKVGIDNGEDKEDDLLSRVLKSWNNNEGDEDESNSYEELAGLFIGLLFAGFHTTSNAITFALGHLAEYPHVYAKVLQEQREIAQSKGEGEQLTWQDIQKMKYTWNVVCESMRLLPPGLGGFREALTDISFAGFTIPKGWKVHWNVYSTHMDPTYFPNPNKFDPSRFNEKLPPRVFVPFGGGSHICCGKEYTRIEILVYLHNVVTRFKLSKANPNEKIIYIPDPVSVEGFRILLQPHEQ